MEAHDGRARPVRLKLGICYDGTDFSGWAAQPAQRTVAGVLGEALAVLFRGPVPMVVAGRTYAGVHATGQVAHIDAPAAALAEEARAGIPATARAETAETARPRLMPLLFMLKFLPE